MNNKALYIILSTVLFCGVFSTLRAQSSTKDTAYNRQISVERDFSPTLQDANKINTLPSLYEPVVKKSNAPLANLTISGNPKLLQLSKNNAGSFGTSIEHDNYRGYAGLRLGVLKNIEAEAGYQAINNEKTKFDIFGTFSTSSATPVKPDYLLKNDNAQAKHNETFFKARYQHTFEMLDLFLSSHFSNTGFNYYGSMYASDNTLGSNSYDWKTNQSANMFNITARAKSKSDATLRYESQICYDYFGLKYGNNTFDTSGKGIKSGILQVDLNLNTSFRGDYLVGLNAHILNQPVPIKYKELKDFSHLKLNPYIDFTGSNWKATVGINTHFTFDKVSKVLLTPNISFSWDLVPTNTLYGIITGGVSENTFTDIFKENRYINPDLRITPSRTHYDAEFGVRNGMLKGIEFNVFAGYKHTSDEHLYYASLGTRWQNLNSVMYADINQGKFGGSIKTSLIPNVNLSAGLTTYFYKVKYPDEGVIYKPKAAWNKPTYALELNADIRPSDRIAVTANYQLAGGRKYYDEYDKQKKGMKGINELNMKGIYQFTKMISATLTINNMFNQQYELSPGYASYGVNLLAGATIKF